MNITVKKIALLVALIALPHLLWVGWALWGVGLFTRRWPAADLQALGQTGDLFGGINALFAAYAFTGVALAAYFQYRTFMHVEEQVQLQTDQATRQAFEPLFFRLLELNRAAVPVNLVYSPLWDGQLSLNASVEQLTYWLARMDFYSQLTNMSDAQLAREVNESLYAQFYSKNEDRLGPYFRTLARVFDLIDRSALPQAEKVRYADIARALLTRSELVLLIFNSSTSRGFHFRPLMERYAFSTI